MRVILVVLMGMLVNVACGPSASAGSTPTPRMSASQEKQAVLSYKACEGGMTVERASAAAIKSSGAQSNGSIRYVSSEGTDNNKYAIEYKAANGSQKAITFGYHPSSGRVGAEDDDALAVLRMLEAGCRR